MEMNIDVNALTQQATELLSLYGLKIVAAILIFFVGKWVARRLVNVARRFMQKARLDETLVIFVGNILYGLALALVVIAALSQLGVETTSLAAVIAAAGLAIGLALQGSLSNLAAGVMIILFRPFKIGDYIEAGGTGGTVEEIAIFTTTFRTPDNKQVIVPNNQITADTITNYSAKSERRVDFLIGVGYGDDLSKVKKVLGNIVAADSRVLTAEGREHLIAVSELADSSVNLVMRVWVKSEDYWNVKFDMTETIKVTFDKEGISIPFPQRDIHVISSETSPSRAAA